MYRFTNFNVLSTVIGLVFSLMAVDSYAAECRVASAGASQWQNMAIPPVQNGGYHTQPGMYSVELTVTPATASSDMLVALSQGPQTNWSNLAAIVRFNTNNTIDVRDGDVYRADTTLGYLPNRQYYIRMEVNLYAHTYSVFVLPGYNYEYFRTGGTQIAKDYKFRTEQQAVSSLDTVVVEAEIGSLGACAEAAKPMLGPLPGGPAQWQNSGLGPIGSSASVKFDVEPLTPNSDTLIALTQGPQTNWANLPMIVRFNTNNTIDVRDGDVYRADTVMPYVAGERYIVTISFHKGYDGNANSYSVFVNGQTLARNYRLRTGYEYLDEITNWTLEAEIGTIRARYIFTETY